MTRSRTPVGADAASSQGTRRLSLRVLPRRFYARETEVVARDLIGRILECSRRGVRVRGVITETEAYLGEHDPACHAAVGRTARTAGLYGPPGTAYVYFIYGMYWCVNAVTRAEGLPSAVLIRGVRPLDGLAAMRRRRPRVRSDAELANGPGKLCLSFGIDGPVHHGADLVRGPGLRILQGVPVDDGLVSVTPRIGISKAADWPLRWVMKTVDGRSERASSDAELALFGMRRARSAVCCLLSAVYRLRSTLYLTFSIALPKL